VVFWDCVIIILVFYFIPKQQAHLCVFWRKQGFHVTCLSEEQKYQVTTLARVD